MKIDKNKPLPDHTKLHYDECCALLVLKELFPDRYSKLESKRFITNRIVKLQLL